MSRKMAPIRTELIFAAIKGKPRGSVQLALDLKLTQQQVKTCITWLKANGKIYVGDWLMKNKRYSPIYHVGDKPNVACPCLGPFSAYHKAYKDNWLERDKQAEREIGTRRAKMIVLPREFFRSAA